MSRPRISYCRQLRGVGHRIDYHRRQRSLTRCLQGALDGSSWERASRGNTLTMIIDSIAFTREDGYHCIFGDDFSELMRQCRSVAGLGFTLSRKFR